MVAVLRQQATNRSRAFWSATGSPEFRIGSMLGPKILTRSDRLSDFRSSTTAFSASSGVAKLSCLTDAGAAIAAPVNCQ